MTLNQFDDTGLGRVLCVVAHPDDMEYGGSACIAKWTRQGVHVRYVLLSAGEAGIRTIAPEKCKRIRLAEQEEACRIVGAELTVLDFPDGLIEPTHEVREAITSEIRDFHPDTVVTINFDFQARWGLNHVDHRACGIATVDAIRDADNPWIFHGAGEPWKVHQLLVTGADNPTHYVDVSGEPFEAGVESLAAHRVYLDNLGDDYPNARELFDQFTAGTGTEVGVANALAIRVMTCD